MTARPPAPRSELVSLTERVAALHALRLGVSAVVLLAAYLAPAVAGSRTGLVVILACYVALEYAVEAVRRRASDGARAAAAVTLIGLGILIDAAFLAAILYRTGGPTSYLSFLVELHVVGVSLLISYRAGLKLSLWYTLLFTFGHFLQRAGVLHGIYPGRPIVLGFAQSEVFGLLAFWMVAVGTAVFSSLSERELRRGKSQLQGLARLAAATAEELEAPRVPELLLDQVCTTFAMRQGVVVVERDGYLDVCTARVLSGETSSRFLGRLVSAPGVVSHGRTEVPAGAWPDPSVEEATRARHPVLVRRLERSDPVLSDAMPGANRVIVMPLVAGGETLGAVALECSGRARGLPARTVEMLGQFVAHAAMALRNAKLHAEVQRLATTDPLTGLMNRRVLDETLSREVARARRRDTPLGLVLLDIDHFKAVNDTHGHQAGDAVLQQVGAAIAGVARAADVAARFGGEEFALLIPDCSLENAIKVAERLRAAVAAAPTLLPVTTSAGVAVVRGHEADVKDLVAGADQALYRAKQRGRNRVEVAGAEPEPPGPTEPAVGTRPVRRRRSTASATGDRTAAVRSRRA